MRCEAEAPRSGTLALHAPVLIAAHGSWEPLGRPGRLPAALHRPGDLFAFKANFAGARLAEGLLPVAA